MKKWTVPTFLSLQLVVLACRLLILRGLPSPFEGHLQSTVLNGEIFVVWPKNGPPNHLILANNDGVLGFTAGPRATSGRDIVMLTVGWNTAADRREAGFAPRCGKSLLGLLDGLGEAGLHQSAWFARVDTAASIFGSGGCGWRALGCALLSNVDLVILLFYKGRGRSIGHLCWLSLMCRLLVLLLGWD